ncbi:sensor histidine kinase [Lysinibacillus sp. BW-2-10]|uniref:sensor histidine kinase n=1 Tax=Lysinibacillus sp. BW-2-10 TaxID=2590030 RepID=UPI00117EE2FC|nr:sensor histidine kinase [Lysinibacillus sp. BW-2-10]TSI10965.1 HAMP domain-containing histidine kinase [Lysinibacillus sp. BW-2-10]
MLILFLKERSAWIVYIILLLLCMNLLFYLDSGFSGVSISYFNIIVISLSVVFLVWQYIKEQRQMIHFLGNLSKSAEVHSNEYISMSPYQKKYMEDILTVFEQKDSVINESKIQLQEQTDDLLAWVHEVKTPLTAMKLMIEQTNDAKLRKKLESEWVRIHLLLDQQLHSTRLATIEKDNRLEKLDLKLIVFKEIREFQSWCLEKGIGFQIEALEESVITDRKWVAFIVRQILSNAIKYSWENEEIQIYTERDQDEHVLLHIKDFGIGIAQQDLPRIFNKSYTGTIGRESVQSTGMGLYLAQNAAQKLGVQISVKSKENEGSTFTLRFPLMNEYHKTFGR